MKIFFPIYGTGSNETKRHLFQRFELSCEGRHMQSGRWLLVETGGLLKMISTSLMTEPLSGEKVRLFSLSIKVKSKAIPVTGLGGL
jgi:hypothetical protein